MVAPLVESIFDALRLVVLAVKPVPETATVVADVKPVPFTTTDCCNDLLGSTEPKLIVEPFVGVANDGPGSVEEPDIVALSVTFIVVLPLVRVSVPVYVPPFAPLKFTWSVAPSVELIFDALRLVEFTEKPVPEMATDVAEVKPVPFTTIDFCTDVLASQVPKSTVEPFAGDEKEAEAAAV